MPDNVGYHAPPEDAYAAAHDIKFYRAPTHASWLNEIFYSVLEAKVLVERWRRLYNTARAHSSLGCQPPATEAIKWPAAGIEGVAATSQPLRELRGLEVQRKWAAWRASRRFQCP